MVPATSVSPIIASSASRRRLSFLARTGFAVLAAAVLSGCTGVPLSSVGPEQMGVDRSTAFGNYLAGRQALANRDNGAAAGFFTAALEQDPDNPNLLRRAFILTVMSGRMSEALAMADQVIATGTSGAFANLVLGADAMRARRFDDARARFSKVPRDGFDRLLGPILDAWAEYGDGRPGNLDRALESLKPLAGEAKYRPFQRYTQALLNDLGGEVEAAQEAYDDVIASSLGRLLRVQEAYGAFLERRGRPADARSFYRKRLEAAPGNPVLLAALKRFDGGIPASPTITDSVQGAAEAFHVLASVLTADNVRDAAVSYLQLALYLRPGFTYAKIRMAEIREAEGRWEDAIALYRGIGSGSPFSWVARIRTAKALDNLGRRDDAIAVLEQMARDAPQRTDALTELGDILRGAARYKEAAKVYGRAIARIRTFDKTHWSLFYARGIAYERSKAWAKAESDFLRALKLQPEQPLVLNYLGYSWVEQGLNFEKARRMIERAVKLRPNDGYIVDSLGWVLYRTGRFQDAVPYLERAVELVPGDPVINDHLGDAYWRVGRRFEARFQWRRALSFRPEQALVPAIEKKLDTGLDPLKAEGMTPLSNGG